MAIGHEVYLDNLRSNTYTAVYEEITNQSKGKEKATRRQI